MTAIFAHPDDCGPTGGVGGAEWHFFAGDPGAPILSAATRRNGVPSLMPGLAAV